MACETELSIDWAVLKLYQSFYSKNMFIYKKHKIIIIIISCFLFQCKMFRSFKRAFPGVFQSINDSYDELSSSTFLPTSNETSVGELN
jgi:hypothetical protein